MARVVTAGELVDGHAVLDIECLDRVYWRSSRAGPGRC